MHLVFFATTDCGTFVATVMIMPARLEIAVQLLAPEVLVG